MILVGCLYCRIFYYSLITWPVEGAMGFFYWPFCLWGSCKLLTLILPISTTGEQVSNSLMTPSYNIEGMNNINSFKNQQK